ncbi:MAG: sel1 repeat family protein [Deltaproteobacteria bacterium]|nr:sel1 repeat family protein [Deltaproteobacteria bacterium]
MRSVVLVMLLGSTAAAAPRAPANLDIDLSKIVLVQPRRPAPTPTLVLCDRNDKDGCMQACDRGSAATCFRLGWMLARGGAENAVLSAPKIEIDLDDAVIALEKACTLGFHAGCVDVEAIRGRLKKPKNTARLRTSCAAGYGRACGALVAGIKDPKARRALVAIAFVVVARDANQSGSLELPEIDDNMLHGVGYLGIGASDMAYPAPNPLDGLFREGITNGVAPYRIIDGDFDDFGIPAPGSTFELDLCVPGTSSCDTMRFPNLS